MLRFRARPGFALRLVSYRCCRSDYIISGRIVRIFVLPASLPLPRGALVGLVPPETKLQAPQIEI